VPSRENHFHELFPLPIHFDFAVYRACSVFGFAVEQNIEIALGSGHQIQGSLFLAEFADFGHQVRIRAPIPFSRIALEDVWAKRVKIVRV
jgi:hypothetical protein